MSFYFSNISLASLSLLHFHINLKIRSQREKVNLLGFNDSIESTDLLERNKHIYDFESPIQSYAMSLHLCSHLESLQKSFLFPNRDYVYSLLDLVLATCYFFDILEKCVFFKCYFCQYVKYNLLLYADFCIQPPANSY